MVLSQGVHTAAAEQRGIPHAPEGGGGGERAQIPRESVGAAGGPGDACQSHKDTIRQGIEGRAAEEFRSTITAVTPNCRNRKGQDRPNSTPQ
jgi:hypothetical protein